MKLTEAIEAARLTQGPKCRVGILLRELPKQEAVELQDCLDRLDLQHSQIAHGMTELGRASGKDWKLSQSSVMKHRGGRCACAG